MVVPRGLARPCHRAGPRSLVHARFTRPVLGLSHARLVLLRVPVVATIYRAVRNLVGSVGSQFQGGNNFKRVVLAEFPHPGIGSLALVTKSLATPRPAGLDLSVCVLTGVNATLRVHAVRARRRWSPTSAGPSTTPCSRSFPAA